MSSKQELQSYLDARGVPYDKRWGEEALKAKINEYEMNNKPQVNDAVKTVDQHHAEKVVESVYHTQEEVEKAIEKFLNMDGFQARFTETDWHFSCKGASEAGNMSVPLRIIKQKAENVSRGRRGIQTLGRDGTYSGSYTDSILLA